ncbi:MAG: L,D-transpeptidase family protein [SAR324 cluster bacterium]|nr:L,D-transpeptidase family protein [SAR324 cluster bacterium]
MISPFFQRTTATLAAIFLLAGGLFSASANPQRGIPDNLIMFGGYGDAALVVDKGECSVSVYRKTEVWKLESKYPCSSGKMNGDKQHEGDERTPNGIYRFIRAWNAKQLRRNYGTTAAKLYGSGALVTDYPNFLDFIYYRKTGNGIWLHGTREVEPVGTRGCVSVRNDDLLLIRNQVVMQRTPMLVEEKVRYLSPEELAAERDRILAFLERWRSSWEEGRNEEYLSLYSEDFLTRRFNYKRWVQHKTLVNRTNKRRHIRIHPLSLLKANGYIEVVLTQDYESSRLNSYGLKALYLRKREDGTYRILTETWKNLPPRQFTALNRWTQ